MTIPFRKANIGIVLKANLILHFQRFRRDIHINLNFSQCNGLCLYLHILISDLNIKNNINHYFTWFYHFTTTIRVFLFLFAYLTLRGYLVLQQENV